MNDDRFEEINVGDEAEIFHKITSNDVETFVKLTGDDNPLHTDDSYAAQTNLKKRVVHGMLTASFISTLIGTKLPGKGALWYEQQTRFLAPVRIGEKIRVWAKVKHKSRAQRILVLETVVFGESDRRVVEGEAKVKIIQSEKIKMEIMLSKDKGGVIISGSSRGIGSAIAKGLANSGHPVLINYLNNEEGARQIAKEIASNGGKAVVFKADVSDAEAVDAMVDGAINAFDSLGGIVNNASAPIEHFDFMELSWDEFQKHIDIQLKGAFNLTRAVMPYLLSKEKGVIVNIASIFADNVPPTKLMPYNLVKAAIVTFSRSLAVEYGPKGIRVNCVSPGMTQTDLIANVPEKVKMVTKMQTPLRRLAVPQDIANTVAFLFSDEASFITGQTIRVCGGITMC
ncbi:glucose 1-dehydrogenase [Thermodesulfobacteriota bacterium]